MSEKLLVFSTAGSETEATNIAHELVERRLAACVNIVPKIQSVYRWNGEIEESEEFLLLIKTTASSLGRVQAAIRELHSYEVPELIAIPIAAGSDDYLKWIADSVDEASDARIPKP